MVTNKVERRSGPRDILFLTSAEHKAKSAEQAFVVLSWTTSLIWIQCPPGIEEPELVEPRAMIVGKLQTQLRDPRIKKVVKDRQALSGTLWKKRVANGDALLVAGDTVLKKPEEGMTALEALARDVKTYLAPIMQDKDCASLTMHNVNGATRLQDAIKPIKEIPIATAVSTLEIGLSGGLVQLLAEPKEVAKLIKRGILPQDLLTDTSISGARWEVLFGQGITGLCRQVSRDEYWVRLEEKRGDGSEASYLIDAPGDETEEALNLYTLYARGVIPQNLVELEGQLRSF